MVEMVVMEQEVIEKAEGKVLLLVRSADWLRFGLV
jgi:hypothetical protein